jgi:hypothetical protein
VRLIGELFTIMIVLGLAGLAVLVISVIAFIALVVTALLTGRERDDAQTPWR